MGVVDIRPDPRTNPTFMCRRHRLRHGWFRSSSAHDPGHGRARRRKAPLLAWEVSLWSLLACRDQGALPEHRSAIPADSPSARIALWPAGFNGRARVRTTRAIASMAASRRHAVAAALSCRLDSGLIEIVSPVRAAGRRAGWVRQPVRFGSAEHQRGAPVLDGIGDHEAAAVSIRNSVKIPVLDGLQLVAITTPKPVGGRLHVDVVDMT